MPIAAIYARQSILKEDSFSIEMQIERAKSYCESQGWESEVYIDEGYSGKDTDRPSFQTMIDNLEKYNYVVVYKLDRISRSIRDFFDLIEVFNEKKIGFQSLTERFDTTTPMGRAMLSIMAVFAQLERETIAERVRDNMLDRASMGLWNGGPVPLGFQADKEVFNGKESSVLLIDDEENELVKWIYKEYLDSSMRKVCKKLNDLNISTKRGSNWNINQMSRILKNPIYCIADKQAYEYFSALDIKMVCDEEDFDGISGLIYYNRREPNGKTTKNREMKEWILAKGHHKGFIPGELFVQVQNKITKSAKQFKQSGYGKKGILAGILKCGKCGKAMVYKDYVDWQYYTCSKSIVGACSGQTIRGIEAEEAVLKVIREICSDKEFLKESAAQIITTNEVDVNALLKNRKHLMAKYDGVLKEQRELVVALGRQSMPVTLIEERVNELEIYKKEIDLEIIEINKKITDMAVVNLDVEAVFANLLHFNDVFNELTLLEKREFLKSIIDVIYVDEGKLEVNLFFGVDEIVGNSGKVVPHGQGFIEAINEK